MNWLANRSKALSSFLLEDYEPADPKWSPTSAPQLASRPPPLTTKETGASRLLKEYVVELCAHPNTFVKFPLIGYEDKLDGDRWRLNDSQAEHARNMLIDVPELSKLRYSLCPAKMSDTQFWNIYFLLLRNKGIDLNDQLQDAQLRLASPAAPKTPSVTAVAPPATPTLSAEDSLEDELDEKWVSYITSGANSTTEFNMSEMEDNYFNPVDFSAQLRAVSESKDKEDI